MKRAPAEMSEVKMGAERVGCRVSGGQAVVVEREAMSMLSFMLKGMP